MRYLQVHVCLCLQTRHRTHRPCHCSSAWTVLYRRGGRPERHNHHKTKTTQRDPCGITFRSAIRRKRRLIRDVKKRDEDVGYHPNKRFPQSRKREKTAPHLFTDLPPLFLLTL